MTMPAGAAEAAAVDDGAPLLRFRGVNKSFGPVHVLQDVDFDVYPGQVTALVGDNGAGKSTLIKGDRGHPRLRLRRVHLRRSAGHVTNPKQANALGIEVVYQDLALCDNLDIVHNLFLGRELTQRGLLDESTMERRAHGDAGRPVRPHRQVDPPARGQPLRWPAADGGDRPRGDLELQARRPRRADRRARRRPDRAGAQAGPPARRQRARGRADQPQPQRRLRRWPTTSRCSTSAAWPPR